VQAFQIPSVSMEPSLLVGDRLFVDKVVYSPSLGPLESALLAKRPVTRGDVVVFKYPADPSRNFVKRVVALPGETVEVRDRVVLVGGQPLTEPYARFGDERLPAGHPGARSSGAQAGSAEPPDGWLGGRGRQRWGPRVVPDGHVFVLGDNRDRSHDSRYWGFLALDQVEGRPLVVYWSTDTEAAPPLAAGLGRPRWERLFHAVR
jgi:signal peptidase I